MIRLLLFFLVMSVGEPARSAHGDRPPARVLLGEQEETLPACGLFKEPPRRTINYHLTLPEGWSFDTNFGDGGIEVVEKKISGDGKEVAYQVTVEPTTVRVTWTAKNPQVGLSNRMHLKIRMKAVPPTKPPMTAKYRLLRDRFFRDFYFAGVVADCHEAVPNGTKVKFADQTINQGLALIFLASEMRLVREHGWEATDAPRRIREILDALDQLDEQAEPYFNAESKLDGCLLRDNIVGPNDPRLNWRFVEVASDWQNPAAENNSPSGDQLFGVLFGLWFVKHWSGDEKLSQRSQALAARLYDYAHRHHFELRLPSGAATRRGSDMRWLSPLMHDLQESITGVARFKEARMKVLGQEVPLNGLKGLWSGVADGAPELIKWKIPMWGLDKPLQVNPFAVHILLMAIAPTGMWSDEDFRGTAYRAHHDVAWLWRQLAQGRLPRREDGERLQEILDRCPDNGPSSQLDAKTTWHTDNRSIRCLDVEVPTNVTADRQYNGVDWLVMAALKELMY